MSIPTRRVAVALLALAALLLPAAATARQSGEHHHHQHHQAPPASGGVEREDGLEIPDVELVDQDGKPVHFYRDLVAGRVVAMNFIFTTCTTVCPPMGANFAAVQKELGERLGRDVRLISVSVDPVTDTPQRLKAWGERFGAGDGWTLVTGPKADVDRLLKALEVFTPDYVDHSPTVLVGNAATGAWRRAYGLAPAKTLTALIDELAATPADGAGGQR
ncbi:MAG: SCO family protein [Acidobacteria bacterium]|nr:MAG: SCO family protein [Acidobacteriota bacterium]